MKLHGNTVKSLKGLKIPSFKWDRDLMDLVEVEVSPTVHQRDNQVFISAEEGDGVADYYSECGYDIHPLLVAWAEKHKCLIEWENAGTLVVYAD